MTIDPKTVVDWSWIRQQEIQVQQDWLAAASLDGEFFADGCAWGWNGKYAPTTLYNLLYWWVRTLQWRRWASEDTSRATAHLSKMVRHFLDLDFRWDVGRPPAEGFSAHPPGLDSDALRHQWAQGFCRLLLDPELAEQVDAARLRDALSKWGTWLSGVNLANLRKADIRGQGAYYRAFAAIESLCWIALATQERRFLTAAEQIATVSIWQNEQPMPEAPGFTFWGGRDEFDQTCSMPSNSEHRTMRPWYAYQCNGLAALYALTESEAVKTLVRTYILSVTDLVVQREALPDFTRPDGKGMSHAPVLLGDTSDSWMIGSFGIVHGPEDALTLSINTTYYPLAVVDAWERDHLYWDQTIQSPWRTLIARRHYPENRHPGATPGPRLDFQQAYPLADALACRYFLTQDQNDLAWALWAYRDRVYWANRPSPWTPATIGTKQGNWFRAGNIGRSRSLAWLLTCGLFLRDLLAIDGPVVEFTGLTADLK